MFLDAVTVGMLSLTHSVLISLNDSTQLAGVARQFDRKKDSEKVISIVRKQRERFHSFFTRCNVTNEKV
jgi:hypothetical protein